MRPLHAGLLALAPLVPLHTGHLHLLADSVLGVAVGLVVVGLYLLTLRWTGGGSDSEDGGSRDRRQRTNR
ncbi:hypothetical protein [Halosimplex amylolyticum]|uniref:hypothetical protein n=1 Tax=Halosimplex amylolyticum TaxID=3396616 RepID=UPI003F569A4D